MTNPPTEPTSLVDALASVRAMRREILRRMVLDEGKIEVLAEHVLGYTLRPFHRELLAFQSAAKDACLQLAPRGFGKSTVLTITRAVFEVLRNPNIRILIASNTQIQAEVFLREIKAHFERNERLRDAFGDFVDERKWDTREIVVAPRRSTAKESTITCVSVTGPVASRHYDLIIADDIVDEENSRTELQRERVKVWLYKTLLPCLEPDGRLFILGTRYHYLDLYGHLSKNDMATRHQVIRAIAPDGSTPWPEKFSIEFLEEKKRQMGSAIFASQYQNDTELMKGNIFKEEWFRFYETPLDPKAVDYFIGCDPAATRADLVGKASTSDFWTVVVGARVRKDGDYTREIYVVEIWRARCTKQEYVDKLRALNDRYRPIEVLVETVAAQEYLAQDLERYMPVQRVDRVNDKVSRAYRLQAYFENGQVLFPARALEQDPEVWQALREELILFPQAEHDDCFDALETMVEGAMNQGGSPVIWWIDSGPFVDDDDRLPWAPRSSRTMRLPWLG
ncbi:MAG: phage terminase large subunit [bacterium]